MNAQGCASENSGAYLEVLNHLRDDYSSENIEFAKGLVNECLSQDIEDTEALDYVISKIIVEQIDDSQLDDCTKGVLNLLKICNKMIWQKPSVISGHQIIFSMLI